MMRIKTDYRMKQYDFFLAACTLALLLSVTIAGAISGGAARWIEIGPIRFQPSEVSKILLIVFFSWLFQNFRDNMGQFKYAVFMAAVLLPPVALILEQPDLSTAIIVVWIFLCMLFMGGLDYKIISRAFCVAVPACGAGLFFITRPGQMLINDYQYRRIMAWLAPQDWVKGKGFDRQAHLHRNSGAYCRAVFCQS